MEDVRAQKLQYQKAASRGPLVFLGMLAFGLLIKTFFDLPLLPKEIVMPMGIVLLVLGSIMLLFAERARMHKQRQLKSGLEHTLDHMMYGLYRFSRHPGYLALLMMFFGFAGVANSMVLFVLGIVTCVLFTWKIIPAEEKLVTGLTCGEYCGYQSKVRMWF